MGAAYSHDFLDERKQVLRIGAALAGMYGAEIAPEPIPAGSMRVGPGTDAVVWRICPEHSAEL